MHLFGSAEILVRGIPLAPLRSRKGVWLLALLTLRSGKSVQRNWLAGTLWPDSSQSQALAYLRHCLTELRHALGPEATRLQSPTRQTLALDLADAAADVLTFDAGIQQGDPAGLQRAVAIYGGPLMDGCSGEWALLERGNREQSYLAALRYLADEALARGDAETAIGYSRRTIAIDPLQEEAQRTLITALAVVGDYGAAVQAYRDLRLYLHHELNTEPDPQTTALHKRLRAETRRQALTARESHRIPAAGTLLPENLGSRVQEPTSLPGPEPVTRSRLPVPITPILGREGEVSLVRDLLRKNRLVTLTGPGGAGKTRLSIEIGEQERANFSDGVWFADFSSLTDPEMVLQVIGQAVGVPQHVTEPWLDLLCKALSTSQRLLIFDNCEHLLESCGQAALDLLSHCGGLKILATSRAPLGVSGEQRFPVPALQSPETGTAAADFAGYSAIRLFEAVARRAVPEFAVSMENASAVAEICRCVDGLPLGIEMAAARVSALSPRKIASKLAVELGFLQGARRGTRRHKSIEAVMEWSYGLLPESAQTLFRRLAVFSGGWTLGAAESVAGFEPLEPLDVAENLEVLVDASLIWCVSDRYSFPDLTRRYALSLFSVHREQETVRNRHVAFMTELFKGALELERGPQAAQVVPIYGADLDNARSALEWCVHTLAVEQALSLVPGVAAAIWKQGNCVEGGAWLERILALPSTNPTSPARIVALQTASWLGPTNTCGRASDQLIQVARDIGDDKLLAMGLGLRGESLIQVEPDVARIMLREAVAVPAGFIDEGDKSRHLSSLGFLETRCGNYLLAAQHFANAANLAGDPENVGALASVLTNRGFLFKSECSYDRAISDFEAAISAFERLGISLIPLLLRLAELYLDCGDFESLSAILPRCRTEIESRPDETTRALLECLTRNLAAHESRMHDALDGSARDLANMTLEASRYPGSDWETYIGLHLESLCLCLCSAHQYNEAARFFGAAQSARTRSLEFVSPSVRRRWDRLRAQLDLSGNMSCIDDGARMQPAEVVEAAESASRVFGESRF